MKAFVSLIWVILLIGVLAAGCSGTQSTSATQTPTPVVTTISSTTLQQPSFTQGEKYLEKKYSFTSDKDLFKEQFRVTNEPWSIELTVNPTNEDPQYTWFEIKATNLDTGHTETYGYGRTNGFEKYQLIPMYNGGPYTFEMRGNRVSVNVNIAKRNL
jgi:hypothetical protein